MPPDLSGTTSLIRKQRVLEQRDIRLVDYTDITKAARDPRLSVDASDTAILLSRNGELFELNMIAAMIWEHLAAPHTVEELAERVGEHFDADLDKVMTDVTELLTELMSMGLIEEAP